MDMTFLTRRRLIPASAPMARFPTMRSLWGEAVKGIRDKVVIATKMGVKHNADRSLRLDSSPGTIRASVEESLRDGNGYGCTHSAGICSMV